ncbi:hypothetical protein Ruko_12100 [Ruthenibacterium sp. TH_2024_36131]|uniref:polysaccharide deacetylase family protein n=1 Tax=Owariibacterium komagatae TaxID=3136601 RepID=UPI0038B33C13
MKRCLVTIDAEGISGPDAIARNIWGGKERVGIDKIMDICDAHGVRGLFFVDMPGGYAYGKNQIKEVLNRIEQRGHIAGVHIHPMHMANPEHDFLWQYTAEEQRKIIDACTKDFEEMTGHPPLYFRAGKYSVNDDTIKILQDYSYQYEFSSFASRDWCHISNPKSKNIPYSLGKLIEIPVTIFQLAQFGKFKRYEKIDLATLSVSELKHVLGQIAKQPYDYPVIFFLHSFSFLDRTDPENVKVDAAAIKRFDKMMECIEKNKDFCFWDIENEKFELPEYEEWMYQDCPSVKGKIRQFCYSVLLLWRLRHMNRMARFLLWGMTAAIVFLAAVIIALIFLL